VEGAPSLQDAMTPSFRRACKAGLPRGYQTAALVW